MTIAKDLRESLTDDVIEKAIKKMPPEVYPISGLWITEKLKSRRDHLQDWAGIYYRFLARHVDIPGSAGPEVFEINRISDDETSVNIYARDKDGRRADTPFYSRLFKNDETSEIRLFGIAGNDVFTVSGKVDDGLRVRMIDKTGQGFYNRQLAGIGKEAHRSV